jgi:hypothetical protein
LRAQIRLQHLAAQLLDGGFDLMTSHRMELDHGFLSPMPMIDEGWRVPVVPMTINVVLDPLPAPARCWALGEAVGTAIKSYSKDLRVAVIGTGGLSHQLTGPDFGKVFAEWDREFLALLDRAPSNLARYTMADFARLGGEHSIEVVQWLAMRAALPERSRMEFNYYYPFGLMGYAIAAFCPGLGRGAGAPRGARSEARRLAGARKRRTKESAMGIRTGRQFLDSLRDDRQIWLAGERVSDVVSHPRLGPAAPSSRCGFFVSRGTSRAPRSRAARRSTSASSRATRGGSASRATRAIRSRIRSSNASGTLSRARVRLPARVRSAIEA